MDPCYGVTCSLSGERCERPGGVCMCGAAATCVGNPAADTCDAENDRCLCGEAVALDGEVCKDGTSMCGAGATCVGNPAADRCDADNNRCLCGLEVAINGKSCSMLHHINEILQITNRIKILILQCAVLIVSNFVSFMSSHIRPSHHSKTWSVWQPFDLLPEDMARL